MKLRLSYLILALALTAGFVAINAAQAFAETKEITRGRIDYMNHCASCHGSTGKGDGPVGKALIKPPTDITELAKKNKGEYPAERVHKFIDGSEFVAAHGTRDMPIWGNVFYLRARSTTSPAQQAPELAERKISDLNEYLKTLQAP